MKAAFTEWETPQDFYEAFNVEFGFTVDVCAQWSNSKHENFLGPMKDSLEIDWKGVCWMNPPYDKNIGKWMRKAWYSAAIKGATVVALIQGRSTDTKWWHEYVMRASEIRYIKDRLHFGKNGVFARANISNLVVVFRPSCKGPPKVSAINIKGERLS